MNKQYNWKKLPTNHLLAGRLMYVYYPSNIWDFFFNTKNFEQHLVDDTSANMILYSRELPPIESIVLVLEDGYHRYDHDRGDENFYKILYDDKIGYIRGKYLFYGKQSTPPFP